LVVAILLCGGFYFYKIVVQKKSPQAALENLISSDETDWAFAKTISEPIKKTSTSSQDVVLGDLEKNAVSVAIPKGSFDADTEVALENPTAPAKYLGSEMDTIGAPIELSVGQPVRLNEKATITFKFDKSHLPAGTTDDQLRVMYYDGSQWEYIKPVSVDFDKGVATFETTTSARSDSAG